MKINKNIFKIICLSLVCTLLIPPSMAKANESNLSIDYYEYSITVESEDWFNYTVQEKVEALTIPDEILKNMTDEALVQAIADYPYLVDIYVYSTTSKGLEEFQNYCSAYKELMSRSSAKQSFLSSGITLMNSYEKKSDERSEFVQEAMNEIITTLYDDVIIYKSYDEKSGISTYAAITTPNGSSVTAYYDSYEAHSTDTHTTADNEAVSTYGVTKIASGTCKYNCHSYAWYSTSTSNKYWIDDPSAYMTDGSYTRVFNGSISSATNNYSISTNDRVYYAGTHTALFKGTPASGQPVATQTCYSKWGRLGVFSHSMSNVPSSYGLSVTIWHR